MNTKEECSNCRFYVVKNNGTYCKRFPPQIYVEEGTTSAAKQVVHSLQVPTFPENWCGEWKEYLT